MYPRSHEGFSSRAVIYLKQQRSNTCGSLLLEAMVVKYSKIFHYSRLFSTWSHEVHYSRLFSTWSHEVHYSRLFSTWSHEVQYSRLFSTWSHEGPALEAVLYLKPWRSSTWGCSLPEAMKVQHLRLSLLLVEDVLKLILGSIFFYHFSLFSNTRKMSITNFMFSAVQQGK